MQEIMRIMQENYAKLCNAKTATTRGAPLCMTNEYYCKVVGWAGRWRDFPAIMQKYYAELCIIMQLVVYGQREGERGEKEGTTGEEMGLAGALEGRGGLADWAGDREGDGITSPHTPHSCRAPHFGSCPIRALHLRRPAASLARQWSGSVHVKGERRPPARRPASPISPIASIPPARPPHTSCGTGQAGLDFKSTNRLQLGCIQKRLKKALYLIFMQVTSHAGAL